MPRNKPEIKERKALLSTLWVFVLGNVVYADILSLMEPASPIRSIMENRTAVPAGGLLFGAVLMEVQLIMIPLSLILPYHINRWISLFAALFTAFFIATGGHGSYYLFFASIEIITLGIILYLSWKKPVSVS